MTGSGSWSCTRGSNRPRWLAAHSDPTIGHRALTYVARRVTSTEGDRGEFFETSASPKIVARSKSLLCINRKRETPAFEQRATRYISPSYVLEQVIDSHRPCIISLPLSLRTISPSDSIYDCPIHSPSMPGHKFILSIAPTKQLNGIFPEHIREPYIILLYVSSTINRITCVIFLAYARDYSNAAQTMRAVSLIEIVLF